MLPSISETGKRLRFCSLPDTIRAVNLFPMTISQTLKEASLKLQPKTITCVADKQLGRLEAEILLAHLLKKDRIWLLAHDDEELKTGVATKFQALVRRRSKHEPVAHLLGEKDFYGRTFAVSKNVLIPRPETELMIDLVKELVEDPSSAIAWDVGTGSGAIAITLALECPSMDVLASDVSSAALAVTRKNAKRLNANDVTFIKSDLLSKSLSQKISLQHKSHSTLVVCANLPYLPTSDKKMLEPDVVKFEPSLALFSGKDGLTLITKLLNHLALAVHEWKFEHVLILIEFDPPQTKTLQKLATALFPDWNITIQQDLAGRDRILTISSN